MKRKMKEFSVWNGPKHLKIWFIGLKKNHKNMVECQVLSEV